MTQPITCATCGATHPFDCPDITGPVTFLYEVMHDPNVPLHDRMYAADILYGLSTLGIYSMTSVK